MTQIRNIYSVQVFALVSKVLNVTRAAKELNISQSSVSYHIKKLEEHLGVSLFRRTAQGLELTEEGSALAGHADKGLAMLRTGLERAARRAGIVRLAVLPMFASRWLSPRLGGLLEQYPDLQLSIQSHNNTFVRLSNPSQFADLGIQWGLGAWPDFSATRLWDEAFVVVCSPGFLRDHNIKDPADLARCMLLHVDDNRMWSEWFAANGKTLMAGQPQMMLEDRHFQLSSTINGLGVSLFAARMIKSELAANTLVDPFGQNYPTRFSYFLTHPVGVELTRATQLVHDWLLAEAATTHLEYPS